MKIFTNKQKQEKYEIPFASLQSMYCQLCELPWCLISVFCRSYYEANDVTSAIEIVEEAFTKHQSLVSMEDVNIAAELYISSKQYDKALAVRTLPFIWVSFPAPLCQPEWMLYLHSLCSCSAKMGSCFCKDGAHQKQTACLLVL